MFKYFRFSSQPNIYITIWKLYLKRKEQMRSDFEKQFPKERKQLSNCTMYFGTN